ncbi:MAG: CPBP family intramembrane metalloprotease [Chlamydiia bacterium]|nr:CPBP family intramembrane metalloprotease [Chlamydiia bacterium]
MAHYPMTSQDKYEVKKAHFFILWVLCILGAWSVLPYVQHLGLVPSSVSSLKIFLLSTVQASLLFGLVCWLSYLVVPKTDLIPFPIDRSLQRDIFPGVIAGLLVGVALYLLDGALFSSSLLSGKHPPVWIGLLASFYGAINEEVLLRLFLFTTVYFLLKKIFKLQPQNRLLILWITNVIVAIIFGLGHLPAAFKLISPSSLDVFRILLLNGIPGVVFGWLYWTRGLLAAMTAHFVTDVVIHAVLI